MFEEHAKNLLVLGTVAAAACASVPAGGSDENPRAVQPERPTVATHAGTVARGYAELESGVERDRLDDGTRAPRSATLWTVSSGLPVRGPLGWALEVYGYPGTSGPAGAPPIVALLAGPTLAVRPTLALDVGFITPLAGPQPHALYAGLVTNFGRVWR